MLSRGLTPNVTLAGEFFHCLLYLYVGIKTVDLMIELLASTFVKNFLIFVAGSESVIETVDCIDEYLYDLKLGNE